MDDDVPDSLDAPALAARLGIPLRTLQTWLKAGVIPRPPPGPRARFSRASIVIAHAVAALRRDGIGLPQIAHFLAKKGDAQLREIAGLTPAQARRGVPALPAPRTPRALPPEATPSSAGKLVSSRPAAPRGGDEPGAPGEPLAVLPAPIDAHDGEPGGTESAALAGSEWRRIELLPGLELHVRKDASPFVQGLAAAIAAGRFAK